MDKAIALAIISGIAVPIVGYFVYRWKARVDVERAQEETPINAMKLAMDRSYQEAAASRAQLHTFMTNHLEHDRQEREKLIEVLTEQKETMKAISQDLIQHRSEERERTASFHDRLNDIDKGIARIEGGIS